MTEISRRHFLGVSASGTLAVMFYPSSAYAGPDDVAGPDVHVELGSDRASLGNDVMRVSLRFAAGSLTLKSLYSKVAKTELQTVAGGQRLFSYELDGLSQVASDDGGWTMGQPTSKPIVMYTIDGQRTVGQQVRLPLSRVSPKAMSVTVVVELYNGRSGLRVYTLLKNDSATDKLTITKSVVLALGFADQPHTTHYVPNMFWKNTRGALSPLPEDTSSSGKRAELPKKAITVYDSGHGWSVSPELNWKGMRGKGNYATDYMLPPYASINAWSGIDHVQVVTNPSALQLVLFPLEEFEYISVNVTVFKGDLIDGKLAESEHFRKRFRYNNVSALFHQNDWDYRGGPGHELPADYYYNTIIPKIKAAGLDMAMLDDGWGVTRDSIEPSDAMKKSIRSLGEFSQSLTANGLKLGLWFTLSGGGHGEGHDLADPQMLAAKKAQIETLITDHGLTHHMIDLTEYWQTEAVTAYSHPTDSAYRKAVLSRRMMNELVAEHPQLLPKMTSELDVWPTQGDRNNGLMHVCDNGWNTSNGGVTGESLSLRTALTAFGHLPMEATYMNIGVISGRMEDYYSYMAVRAVKFAQDPGSESAWPAHGIKLMATFNAWRKTPRVRALTEQMFRPVYLGTGWDGTNWDSSTGPYVWMYVSPDCSRALVIATGVGGQADGVTANLRWLDDRHQYMVSDITLNDDGSHSYAYRGTFTGTALKASGFPIDLRDNGSRGKAFWIEQHSPEASLQVQYADEHVAEFSCAVANDQLTVRIKGTPNSTATLVTAAPRRNTGLVRSVQLDAGGEGVLTVKGFEMVPPPPVSTYFTAPVVFQAEALTRTTTPATVATTEIAEANASNGKWIRADFTATGQRIEFTIDVPSDGLYDIAVRFKENASRGMSQPYLNGEVCGPEINHYYPGRVFRGIEFRERNLGSRQLTAGNHVLAFESTGRSGTSYAVGVDQIKLIPTAAKDRTIFEVESVRIGASKPVSLITEAAASPARGGACEDLVATEIGDWVDYQITVPKVGNYRLATMAKKHGVRGQFQLHVEGKPLGSMVDSYLPNSDGEYHYVEFNHGTVFFDSAGPKTLRYLIVGKHPQSGGFRLGLDYIAVTPVGQLTVEGPATVKRKEQIQLQASSADLGLFAAPKYLLWSVDGAAEGAAAFIDGNGLLTGRQKGTAVVRVRSQVDLTVSASMTVTVT